MPAAHSELRRKSPLLARTEALCLRAASIRPSGYVQEEAWRDPQTFAELTQVMLRFASGELAESPEHGGPLDPESEEILEHLVRFNQSGFMTIGSQPTLEYEGGVQLAAVFGFAGEDLAHRIGHLADVGSLGVLLTAPGGTGTHGGYGDLAPMVDDFPNPEWLEDVWRDRLSPAAYEELQRQWFVAVFDTNDRDPQRLWRDVLDVIEGPPSAEGAIRGAISSQTGADRQRPR